LGNAQRRVDESTLQEILTQISRKLETIKLINRRDMETVTPYVECELSNLGLSLQEKVCVLDRWVEESLMEAMPTNRVNYVCAAFFLIFYLFGPH